jgi:hypothetical protein
MMRSGKGWLLLLISFLISVHLYGQEEPVFDINSRKYGSFIIHAGNLTGVGAGYSYRFTRIFGMSALMGMGFPSWGEKGGLSNLHPYPGNQFNAVIKVNIQTWRSLYTSISGHLGYYKISDGYEEGWTEVKLWQPSFALSFGLDFSKFELRKFCIEIGLAFGFPDEVSGKSYLSYMETEVSSRRHAASWGSLFPFMGIIVRI